MEDLTLVAVVAIALFFDFTNGFHDTANSIATSVSTRALSPRLAVLSAAILNVVGAVRLASRSRPRSRPASSIPTVVTLDVRPRRARRRDHLEPDHLVPRPALELEPRAHRRHGRLRRSPRAGSASSSGGARRQGADPVAPRAAARDRRRGRAHGRRSMWIVRRRPPSLRQPRLPPAAARLGRLRRASRTGRTTRRRRWASSRSRSSPPGTCSADFDRPPIWVIVSAALAMGLGTYAGGWRIIKTLGHADREARPAAGLRRADVDRGDPLGDRALRLPGLDDAHDLRLGARRRRDAAAVRRALGRRRQHPRRVGA